MTLACAPHLNQFLRTPISFFALGNAGSNASPEILTVIMFLSYLGHFSGSRGLIVLLLIQAIKSENVSDDKSRILFLNTENRQKDAGLPFLAGLFIAWH